MFIVFATSGLEFDGTSLQTGSLGGSETAMICVARELAKLGHTVRVYCECKKEGSYEGVRYLHAKNFKQQCALAEIDVLIASRWSEFLTYKVPAGLRVLWCHDILTSAESIMPGLFQADLLMLLSKYQIEQYCGIVPELRKHIWKTSNGVDLDLVEKCKRPKVKKKLIYTSRPERGLPFLIEEILPKILEKHPDAKLYCCTYKNDRIEKGDPALREVAESERLAAKYPSNVVLMGNLNKEQLYCQISSSQLWLFPTSFSEIFCIGSAEAQACGTPPITTNDFALKEVVGPNSGWKIDGPQDEAYADKFASVVNDLLSNPEDLKPIAEEGSEWIRQAGYSWEAVAKSWENKFADMLSDRWENNKTKVLQELERRSDLIPAKKIAEAEGSPEDVERISKKIHAAEHYGPDASMRDQFEAAIPRFKLMGEVLQVMGKKPQKILDYRATEAAFGLVAAAGFPDSEITILVHEQKSEAVIKANAEKAGLKNVRVIDKLAANESFDFVFADEAVDSCVNPSHALKSLMAWTKQDGVVGFTSRYGANGATLRASYPDRLWNLDQADFRKMFAERECDHHISFQASSTSGGDLQGHWCVAVRRTTKIDDPDAFGRMLRTRPYKSLAVCMIVKNEEEWLTGCLKSVQDIADKIVIADTGSEDGTRDIGLAYGAEIRRIQFEDFSQSRNASIADISEDWIFWLDADERLISGDAIKKYLHSEIYDAFVVRQHHLMIDKPRAFDGPIRLFKNKSQYKFAGRIHEQVDDISEHPYDESVNPAFVIEDADIAHYGYLNERLRRQKSSNRNLNLLLKDVHENPERLIAWFYVMRDYMNVVKWWKDRGGGQIQEGSFWHQCLNATISTYHAKFAGKKHRFVALAEPMYRDALRWLGVSGLCWRDMPTPPFEVAVTLAGALGGINEKSLSPEHVWFLCPEESKLYLESKISRLHGAIFGGDYSDEPRFQVPAELPDPEKLLQHACNLFESRAA